MADTSITAVALGRWQTNCVVVSDHAARRAFVVDPGEGGEDHLPTLLDRLDVGVEAILLTHGHLDHIWAVPSLAERLDVPVHLHPADRFLWDNPADIYGVPANQARAAIRDTFGLDWSPPTQRLVEVVDGAVLDVAGFRLTVAHAPGHTPGSVAFRLHDVSGADVAVSVGTDGTAPDEVLVAGDFLFAGSIGRTDFPRGSMEAMMASLRRHLPALAADTLVVAGHGPETTIGHELATNPYVRQALAIR